MEPIGRHVPPVASSLVVPLAAAATCRRASGSRQRERRLPKVRSRWNRLLFNDTLLACVGVTVAVGLFVVGGLALDWWVYHDRYGIGFADYLRTFVF